MKAARSTTFLLTKREFGTIFDAEKREAGKGAHHTLLLGC